MAHLMGAERSIVQIILVSLHNGNILTTFIMVIINIHIKLSQLSTCCIHIITGSGMANHSFYLYPAYPPPQQEAPDLLALYNSLEERVKHLEAAMVSGNATGGDSSTSMPSVLELSREQELTVHMILSSAPGWRVTLRKILVIVFGMDTLAGSCAVGRKNSTTTALSTLKLNALKAM